ncbi:hypothetical protein [Arcobacter sp. CECT 8985]|uniref:hypothetical protein n=1 Tax=Arcobacter sp. CECT 8985 TaxID=1935424 RepID=UPI00100B68BE|nr:hypothetical protein [Arcobacter sp. CECT 8985]RXJ85607.1 hypothetical protein CRU93_10955 [Arcobacter sp. CECT 8985]
MKKTFSLLGLLLAIMLMVTGCGTALVQNVDNSGFTSKSLSLSKVENAIKKGAIRKGWRTKKIKSGLIVADITVRGKHYVAVNIAYNSKGYKISYRDSKNMDYDPAKNTIHPNYNKWVAYLQRNINYELTILDK